MKTFAICFVALFAVAFAKSVIDDKIIGGRPTTIEQHPHQISLRNGDEHICGGSIISAERALTTASCVKANPMIPSRYSIQAGSTNRTGDANAQKRPLSRLVRHAQYNTPRLANDIAILFWEEPLTIGANVRPIELPAANAAVPYGQASTTTGWGRTRQPGPFDDILQVVSNQLITNEACDRHYFLQNITEDMVCAGGAFRRGACFGDAGGPMVHNNILIGITSWGDNQCINKDYPTVYARVAFFVDWINQNII